jgi:hypothetical protein
MADRADLLRRIAAVLDTPHERVHTRYALGLLREAHAALVECINDALDAELEAESRLKGWGTDV